MQVGQCILPLTHSLCFDHFRICCQINGDAQARFRFAAFYQRFKQLVITVRRFNKDLGAVLIPRFVLDLFY